jgi:Capsule polysaccharide biosynthesis protein
MRKILGRLLNLAGFQRQLTKLFRYLDSAPQSQKSFRWICKNRTWYYVLRARELRLKGDDHTAFITLMMGQRCTKNDSAIYLGLSALYRDNNNIVAAHTHLSIANILNPGYSTIRLLTFESDAGLLEAGSKTMEKVLDFPESIIRNHISMLNRISIFYPEHTAKLDNLRRKIKIYTESSSNSSSIALTKAINLAISNRFVDTASNLRSNAKVRIFPKTLRLLDRLIIDLGKYQNLLDLCWRNETSADLHVIYKNQTITLESLDQQNEKIVELFIPAVFFSHPDHEKPTFGTIRTIFLLVINYLMRSPNLVIVPRFQLYWNQCMPKTKDCYVISYHTSSLNNPRHLHIQESPLAQRCSFDNSGFAGYSSIATNYSVIRNFTHNITHEVLKQHQEKMYETYVSANISKYFQPSSDEIYSFSYVFVVLQVPTDIVSRLAYINGIELLKTVVDHYRGTDVKVVVKRHPFCGSMEVARLLVELEEQGEIIRTTNSIHSVIKNAQMVLTVNSGVGLEALIQGKKVVVTGICDYSYAAFTAKKSSELREIISSPLGANMGRIQKFLYFYIYQFTFSCENPESIDHYFSRWLK